MSKNTAYIHIGMDKTGTTSIQRFFSKNHKSILEKYDILYPEIGKSGDHHIELAHCLGYGWEPRNTARKNEILEYYRSISGKDIFISTEHFCFNSNKNNHKLMREELNKFDVRIILYIRNIADWFRSLYSEAVKWGCTESFKDYVLRNVGRANVADFIREWEDEFGIDNVIVSNFDEEKVNLLKSLFSSIDRDLKEGDYEAIYENPSFGAVETELLRRCHVLLGNKPGNESYKVFKKYRSSLEGGENIPERTSYRYPFPQSVAKEIIYQSSRLAEKHPSVVTDYMEKVERSIYSASESPLPLPSKEKIASLVDFLGAFSADLLADRR